MEDNGASGEDAYRFYYNNFTSAMWYEYVYDLEHPQDVIPLLDTATDGEQVRYDSQP